MKKTVTNIALLLLLANSILPVFALSKREAGRILDNFKQTQYEILFDESEDFLNEQDLESFSSYNKMNVYGKLSSDIKSKREYLEQQAQEVAKRTNSLESALSSIDSEIASILAEADKTNQSIVFTREQVEKNKAALDLLSTKVDENRKIILDYIVHIYKKGNYVFDGEEVDNLKAIIMNGEDIDTIINDIYFKWIIEVTGQQLIDQHRSYIKQLYLKKVALENEETSLKQLRKSLMLQKKVLDDKKALKQRLLDVSKWKEDLYQKYIADKLGIEKQIKIKELQERIKFNNTKKKLLEKYECEFIDLNIDTVFSRNLDGKCLEMNKIIFAEWKLASETLPSQNPLIWPILPYYWLSAYYKDPEYTKELGSTHEAIDIIAPQWTPIKAPADGYVMYLNPPTTNDYAFIALKHTDGFVTVYGHVNEITVKEGDFLKMWQEFGKSGWEYGTLWAGIMTTGPHLHFEVFKDQVSVDPLEFVDTSYLAYNELPEKYKYKFWTDFKTRKGVEYTFSKSEQWKKIFKLEWETEVERQKYLLEKYAVPAFRDWNMWVEEALDWNIDPSFIMCVWLAETWLGRNLKTPYNVWNIGNTDSWATKNFQNARSWIYWMVQTLNNRFLGSYKKISDLSRYGNKNWSIYASSSDHWHNNVTKCMSHIKQKYIPDDYPFRIE